MTSDIEPHADPDRIAAQDEVVAVLQQAYELHAAGRSYREIAARLGCAASTAYKMVQRHKKRAGDTYADPFHVWREQLADLQMLRRNLINHEASLPADEKDWQKLTVALIKIHERTAELTGIERPPSEFDRMTTEELAEMAGPDGERNLAGWQVVERERTRQRRAAKIVELGEAGTITEPEPEPEPVPPLATWPVPADIPEVAATPTTPAAVEPPATAPQRSGEANGLPICPKCNRMLSDGGCRKCDV